MAWPGEGEGTALRKQYLRTPSPFPTRELNLNVLLRFLATKTGFNKEISCGRVSRLFKHFS